MGGDFLLFRGLLGGLLEGRESESDSAGEALWLAWSHGRRLVGISRQGVNKGARLHLHLRVQRGITQLEGEVDYV